MIGHTNQHDDAGRQQRDGVCLAFLEQNCRDHDVEAEEKDERVAQTAREKQQQPKPHDIDADLQQRLRRERPKGAHRKALMQCSLNPRLSTAIVPATPESGSAETIRLSSRAAATATATHASATQRSVTSQRNRSPSSSRREKFVVG